jgi:hypothetical protein
MKLSRKVTDFIRLEEGNIGRKSAVVTGALLASSVLGTVLIATVSTAEGYYDHCDEHMNNPGPHTNYYDSHSDRHWDGSGIPCP